MSVLSTILSANTYSILQYLLQCPDQAIEDSVLEAVRIANTARQGAPDTCVAGCISAHNSRDTSIDDVAKSLRLLVSALARASVDCILVEMIQEAEKGAVIIREANAARIPVMLGFSVVKVDGRLRLKDDDVEFTATFVQQACQGAFIEYVGVMHSDIHLIDEALYVVEQGWPGLLLAYPDSGTFSDNVWTPNSNKNKDNEKVDACVDLTKRHPKLQLIGGCCGLGPSFIQKLRQRLW